MVGFKTEVISKAKIMNVDFKGFPHGKLLQHFLPPLISTYTILLKLLCKFLKHKKNVKLYKENLKKNIW